jgi:hypothetical protein
MEKFGSEINIPGPQHCFSLSVFWCIRIEESNNSGSGTQSFICVMQLMDLTNLGHLSVSEYLYFMGYVWINLNRFVYYRS